VRPFIERLADCITRQEGKTTNNNPGNIWDGIDPPHKLKRIWPQFPIDYRGLLVLPDEATGRAMLLHDLRVKISRHDFNLRQAIEMYCPRSDKRNDTDAYIANVAKWMAIDPDVKLAELEREDAELIARLVAAGEIKEAA